MPASKLCRPIAVYLLRLHLRRQAEPRRWELLDLRGGKCRRFGGMKTLQRFLAQAGRRGRPIASPGGRRDPLKGTQP